MRKETSSNPGLSRRVLLKCAGLGACYLGLFGITGCLFEENGDLDTKKPGAKDVKDKGKVKEKTQITADYQKGLINPKPSPWFKELDNDRLKCKLCPFECEIEPGERARCKVRENREGQGYTLAYANPALLQEDPIERKPFFHVIPGSRALSVSTAGCNLECKFCEVWDMALEYPEDVFAYDVSSEKVIEFAKEGDLPSVSFAFGEPVIFYEYMEETAALAKEKGLLNLVHTAGFIQPDPLKKLADKVDAFNVDLKSFEPEFYREVVGGELEPVLNSLKILRDAGVHIEITNIIIPDLNDDMEKIEEMCLWIANELGEDVPLHFSRFYPLYQLSDLPRTPVSTLENAREIAMDAGLNYVYLAKVSDHEGENTFCPECHEVIIERLGFVIEEVNMEGNACGYCGHEIKGIWE